jgi:hypothetical protein
MFSDFEMKNNNEHSFSCTFVFVFRTQEYFVRNAKQGLLPTTHLITKEAAGQKFTAAKKWGIPALSKM